MRILFFVCFWHAVWRSIGPTHSHGQECLQGLLLEEIVREAQKTRDALEMGPVQRIPNEQLREFWTQHLGRTVPQVGPCPNPVHVLGPSEHGLGLCADAEP